jgi:hypothetical protein
MYQTSITVAGITAAAAVTDPGRTLPFTGGATDALIVFAAICLFMGVALRVLSGRRHAIRD